MDEMYEIGFRQMISAPVDILGKRLTLLHWSGATHGDTLNTVDEAAQAVKSGWTRYRIDGTQEAQGCPTKGLNVGH